MNGSGENGAIFFEGDGSVISCTFKDNFGLDKDDLPPQYAAIPGFKSWFILQHSKKYNGKYKPFKTVVVLDKEFSGILERNK